MKRAFAIIALVGIVFLLSLLPVWKFSEHISIPVKSNPLWTRDHSEISSPLTQDLIDKGFSFHTERGAEAAPDGICFGDFGPDEYWVITYNEKRHELSAKVWILDVDWIGHISSSRRFTELKEILQKHLIK